MKPFPEHAMSEQIAAMGLLALAHSGRGLRIVWVTGQSCEDVVSRSLFEGLPSSEVPYITEGNMASYRGQKTVVLLRPTSHTHLPLFLVNMARHMARHRIEVKSTRCCPACLVIVSKHTPERVYGNATPFSLLANDPSGIVRFLVLRTAAGDAEDPLLCKVFRHNINGSLLPLESIN